MVAQRLRRWANIKPTLVQRVVLAGLLLTGVLFCADTRIDRTRNLSHNSCQQILLNVPRNSEYTPQSTKLHWESSPSSYFTYILSCFYRFTGDLQRPAITFFFIKYSILQ